MDDDPTAMEGADLKVGAAEQGRAKSVQRDLIGCSSQPEHLLPQSWQVPTSNRVCWSICEFEPKHQSVLQEDNCSQGQERILSGNRFN